MWLFENKLEWMELFIAFILLLDLLYNEFIHSVLVDNMRRFN